MQDKIPCHANEMTSLESAPLSGKKIRYWRVSRAGAFTGRPRTLFVDNFVPSRLSPMFTSSIHREIFPRNMITHLVLYIKCFKLLSRMKV